MLRGLIGVLLGHPDGHDHGHPPATADARGVRALKLSLAGLAVTALLQLALFVRTGSVALMADTIHNFSDALTSIPLWVAFVLARRAATRRFTFGYRRAEDLAGLFIVAMIALSAVVAGWESIRRLASPQPVSDLGLVAAAGVIGFIGNELVALYRIRVGREIGSAALVADGHHAQADGLTSLAVVAGAIGVMLGWPQADPLVGLAITVAILFVLRDAVREVFGRLMDAVDPALTDRVERVARAMPSVEAVEAVRVRWLGHGLDASLRLTVDCELSVAEGHRVAEKVRHELLHEVPRLEHVLVHVDPCDHADVDHHEDAAHHTARQAASTQR